MKGSISGNIRFKRKLKTPLHFDGLLELQAFDGEITVGIYQWSVYLESLR